jgi:hypothetical protein
MHLATGGGGSSSASNNVERISSSNFLDVRGSVGHRHRRFSARSVARRVRHGGHQDVYRNEPFQVIKGSSSMFGCRATVISTRCRGFVKFHLLKGPEVEDHTLYASHTVWKDRATFEAWTGGVTPTLKKGMCFGAKSLRAACLRNICGGPRRAAVVTPSGFALHEGGWVRLRSKLSEPFRPTPDRLSTALSLSANCGLLKQLKGDVARYITA